jgi:hypothetical protein
MTTKSPRYTGLWRAYCSEENRHHQLGPQERRVDRTAQSSNPCGANIAAVLPARRCLGEHARHVRLDRGVQLPWLSHLSKPQSWESPADTRGCPLPHRIRQNPIWRVTGRTRRFRYYVVQQHNSLSSNVPTIYQWMCYMPERWSCIGPLVSKKR